MANKILPLTILTTGGTIEKIYDEYEGALQNKETIVRNKILEKLRLPYSDIQLHVIMSKDSLFMDDKDRSMILEFIKVHALKGYPIVILHGTDTMEVTAKFCFDHFPEISVPVIFTGAMKPLGFDDSDAPQNVIEAVFATQLVKPGYYVTFHGRIFNVPNVRKNKQKRTFEEIE